MNDLPPLMTIQEVRRLIGRERVGRDALYRVFRVYGVRLGKRLLLPRTKVQELLEGRLGLEADNTGKNPAGVGGKR